jgi:hypothetical protein
MNSLSRLLLGILGALTVAGGDAPGSSAVTEGQALAAELRSSRPVQNLEVQGVIRRRDAQGRRTRVPFRYQVVVGPREWRSIYEIDGTEACPAEKLVVVHADGQPTRYLLHRADPQKALAPEPALLTGDQAMIPFAKSDFWLADLGLEFVHWPEHRIVEDSKIKRRKGRVCRILESVNPARDAKGYTRVRSWIDNDTGKPILAEAYDADGRLVKEFEIGGLTKVNDRWELKDLEMRDGRTDSQTVLEFRYEVRE